MLKRMRPFLLFLTTLFINIHANVPTSSDEMNFAKGDCMHQYCMKHRLEENQVEFERYLEEQNTFKQRLEQYQKSHKKGNVATLIAAGAGATISPLIIYWLSCNNRLSGRLQEESKNSIKPYVIFALMGSWILASMTKIISFTVHGRKPTAPVKKYQRECLFAHEITVLEQYHNQLQAQLSAWHLIGQHGSSGQHSFDLALNNVHSVPELVGESYPYLKAVDLLEQKISQLYDVQQAARRMLAIVEPTVSVGVLAQGTSLADWKAYCQQVLHQTQQTVEYLTRLKAVIQASYQYAADRDRLRQHRELERIYQQQLAEQQALERQERFEQLRQAASWAHEQWSGQQRWQQQPRPRHQQQSRPRPQQPQPQPRQIEIRQQEPTPIQEGVVDCSICLESVTSDRKVTRCRHTFHRQCLNQWQNQGQNTCPNCRGAL